MRRGLTSSHCHLFSSSTGARIPSLLPCSVLSKLASSAPLRWGIRAIVDSSPQEAPAVGHGVTAVAAVDNIQTTQLLRKAEFTVDGSPNATAFAWAPGAPAFGNLTLPLWPVETGSGDACGGLPENTPNLSSYIVLTRASASCNILQQARFISDHGGQYIMSYGTTEV